MFAASDYSVYRGNLQVSPESAGPGVRNPALRAAGSGQWFETHHMGGLHQALPHQADRRVLRSHGVQLQHRKPGRKGEGDLGWFCLFPLQWRLGKIPRKQQFQNRAVFLSLLFFPVFFLEGRRLWLQQPDFAQCLSHSFGEGE